MKDFSPADWWGLAGLVLLILACFLTACVLSGAGGNTSAFMAVSWLTSLLCFAIAQVTEE